MLFVRTGGVMLLLGIPGAASGQSHTPMNDRELQARIAHELAEEGIQGVTVAVANGVVTLSGTVPSLWAKQEAIDEARELDDVSSVVSKLSVARPESDEAIANEVAEKIRRYVFYSVYDDVTARVQNGVVTLEGKVTSPHKAHEIARLVSRIPGVQDVRNNIMTLPVSMFDDELRWQIASRIYNDPIFLNAAIQLNPPIHVVVENGRVTLTGVVNSEVEKRKAEAIARSTFGVFSVDNKLEVVRGR
jgi:osmotically-inducible protein OsmY